MGLPCMAHDTARPPKTSTVEDQYINRMVRDYELFRHQSHHIRFAGRAVLCAAHARSLPQLGIEWKMKTPKSERRVM